MNGQGPRVSVVSSCLVAGLDHVAWPVEGKEQASIWLQSRSLGWHSEVTDGVVLY